MKTKHFKILIWVLAVLFVASWAQAADTIRIGWNSFKFIVEDPQDPNQTATIKKSWIPGVYYTEDDK